MRTHSGPSGFLDLGLECITPNVLVSDLTTDPQHQCDRNSSQSRFEHAPLTHGLGADVGGVLDQADMRAAQTCTVKLTLAVPWAHHLGHLHISTKNVSISLFPDEMIRLLRIARCVKWICCPCCAIYCFVKSWGLSFVENPRGVHISDHAKLSIRGLHVAGIEAYDL